jgi:branched-subunit amino acid aminotransferase/4-amino-4-deoxychorismate lyase
MSSDAVAPSSINTASFLLPGWCRYNLRTGSGETGETLCSLSPVTLGVARGWCVVDVMRARLAESVFTPFLLERHLERLLNGAEQMEISTQHSPKDIYNVLIPVLQKMTGFPEFAAALGSAKECELHLRLEPEVRYDNSGRDPIFTAFCTRIRPIPDALRLATVQWRRRTPELKRPGEYAEAFYLLAQMQRTNPEVNDVLCSCEISKQSTIVFETSCRSIFAVRNGALYTPGLDVLPGVTRALVCRIARALEIPVEDSGVLTLMEILRAKEVFTTGAISGIVPVVSIDGKSYAVGPITQKLALILVEERATYYKHHEHYVKFP